MEKPLISVIGLGYVGLPVSISFDEAGYKVIGMDLNEERINQLKSNYDKTNEINNFFVFKVFIILSKRAKKHIKKGSLSKVIKDVNNTVKEESRIKNLLRQVKIIHE